MEEAVTEERLRQLRVEERTMAGETRGRVAASGARVTSGSALEVLAEQEREFARERAITAEVGASRAQTALKRGENLARQYRYQGYSDAAGSLANIFSIIGGL